MNVDVWPEGHRLVLRDGVWPLAGYRHSPVEPKPYLYPLAAANARLPGLEKSLLQDAPADHPHHRGLWYGHGEIAGHDFWLEGPGKGAVRHTGFESTFASDDAAGFVATADWRIAGGELLARDRRAVTLRRREDAPGLVLDLEFTLTPACGKALALGKCVDSGFPALRVADMLDLFDGGHVLDANGDTDHDAGTRPSPWLAVWGELDRSPVAEHRVCGLAVVAESPRRWFVRPFGWLTGDGTQFDPSEVPASGLTTRHRLLTFAGEPDPEAFA